MKAVAPGAPAHAEPLLVASGVRWAYGYRQVLAGISLALHPGEVLAVFGPNGAGKSTLLRLCAGLLRPTVGSVARPAGRLALIAHNSGLFGELTAADNLTYYARLLGLGHPRQAAMEAIAAEGLRLAADRPVATLSRGTVQRLGICRAFLGEPHLLLADEPASGLDAGASARLAARLAALAGRGGAAILVAHDIPGTLAVADRYVVLAGGVIADGGALGPWRGRPEAFAERYAQVIATRRRPLRAIPAPLAPGAGAAGRQAAEGVVPAGPVLGAVLRREARLWLHGRERLGAMLAFGLLVALIFGFALDPTAVNLHPVFAGVLEVALLFAGLPAFARSCSAEWEADALDAYRATGAGAATLFYAKVLAHLAAFAVTVALLLCAFLAVLSVAPGAALWPLALALGLGAAGFVPAATLLAMIVARALGERGGGLLPLIALPLLSPLCLATVRAGQAQLDGIAAAAGPWWGMLVAYAALFWFLPWILFPLIAEA